MKKKCFLKVSALVSCLLFSAGLLQIQATADNLDKVQFDEKNIVLTAATISDPHIGYSGNDEKLKNTLRVLSQWAGDEGVDMFISAGDNTQNGVKEEADYFMDILSNHYDLTQTPIVTAHGNHDVYWTGCMGRSGFYDAYNAKGMYAFDQDLTGAKQGNRHVEVNGYHFLTVDIEKYGNNYNTLSAATETWLNEKLATLSTENAGEPIFVISHSPAMNTTYGSILGDAEYGDIVTDDTTAIWGASVELDNILKDYPQVISINGHTHYAVNHDLAIMQTSYTSFTPGGAADLAANKDTEDTASGVMPNARSYSQGTLLQIDSNHNVRITRIDIAKNQQIRESWIIPAPKADGSHLQPYSYKRGETNTAPVFPENASINALFGASSVNVTYPTASDDGLVYSYRIALKGEDGTTFCTTTSLAPWLDYPKLSDIPATLTHTFMGVKPSLPCIVEVTAIDCWGAETTLQGVVEQQSTFELLDETASFDNADTKLQYDIATKTGTANNLTGLSKRYFSYQTEQYVNTPEGVREFAGFTVEYSVTYTNIGTFDQYADANYVGMLFSVDGYTMEYRLGGLIRWGGSDLLGLGSDANSPFAVTATGNQRKLKSVVISEEDPTATIVFQFTPKVGNTNGKFSVAVDGVFAGEYEYGSTSLPKLGLQVGKNSANIADASIKVLGATGWFENCDLMSNTTVQHEVITDGATANNDFSYDFANKVGYIGGSASGAGVATGERATAYFTMDTPDKVVAMDGSLMDYSSVQSVKISMTFSHILAADGAFDATDNNEFIAIRLSDSITKQRAGFWVAPGAIFGHYGVIERSNTSASIFQPSNTASNIRFGGNTNPWVNGSIKISLEITCAKNGQDGEIKVFWNDVLQTTIVYTGTAMPMFGMYSRGACAKVTDVSYELIGIKDIHKHTEEILPAVSATCTTSGLTEGKRCTVCGETLVAQKTIPAAHTEETLQAVAPTCTETGLTEGKKCSVCGETLVAQEVAPALGHDTVKTDAVAPNCTEDGNVEFWFCNICSKIFADEACTTEVADVVIPALGHTEETLQAVAPNCTETGLTEGKKCSVCGETLVAQEVVPALGHTESDWIVDKEAEIGVAGSRHKECTKCHETLKTEEIPALAQPEKGGCNGVLLDLPGVTLGLLGMSIVLKKRKKNVS